MSWDTSWRHQCNLKEAKADLTSISKHQPSQPNSNPLNPLQIHPSAAAAAPPPAATSLEALLPSGGAPLPNLDPNLDSYLDGLADLAPPQMASPAASGQSQGPTVTAGRQAYGEG